MKHFASVLVALGFALTASAVRADITLTGSGATFPEPLYQKWIAAYTRLHADVKLNYTGKGSGAGIKEISDKVTDFAGSDAAMTDAQLKAAGAELLHVPMVMGAVVPIYNLPGVEQPLKFSGPVLADLFLGNIKTWNDAKLAALNPGVTLPNLPVTIVHRSDGSGTTFIFTDYLSKVSKEWDDGPSFGTAVQWPAGIGAPKNPGVAQTVKSSPGALGYVELLYALENKIAYGDVINAAGKAVHATPESVSEAAATLKEIPTDLRVNINNAPGEAAYPIAGVTWILVYKNQADAAKGKALVDYLWWCVHEGQALAPASHYAPIPPALLPKVEQMIQSVTANGQPLNPGK